MTMHHQNLDETRSTSGSNVNVESGPDTGAAERQPADHHEPNTGTSDHIHVLPEPAKSEFGNGLRLTHSHGTDAPAASDATKPILVLRDPQGTNTSLHPPTSAESPTSSFSSNRREGDAQLTSSEIPSSDEQTVGGVDGSQQCSSIDLLPSKSLLSKLRKAKVEGPDKEGVFIPTDDFDQLINSDSMNEVLGESQLALEQWMSRRKIFAILALMEKLEVIGDFVNEKVDDSMLPFVYTEEESEVCCKSTGKPIHIFRDWKSTHKDLFQMYQWWMMSPYLTLGEENIGRLAVDDNVVLPFTQSTVESEGHFSEVRKVRIHQAHYNWKGFSTIGGDMPYFAVKSLAVQTEATNLNNQEVQTLIRLNNKNHPNLIKLLATFQHKRHLHLVFPWADGNLQAFWKEKYPSPESPDRDYNLARWVVAQCLGLALGLKAIHHDSMDDTHAQEQGLQVKKLKKMHGRHGDFKPENILWFKHHGSSSSGGVTGVLQISDFGFADFHTSRSKSEIPLDNVMGITPTYRAPEWDVERKVSASYDIWCFGCVLLEFVEWYLRGWHGVKDFQDKRLADKIPNLPGYTEDTFFKITHVGQDMRKAVAKEAVRLEIHALRHIPQSSDLILDLLDYIEDFLLRMHPNSRHSCDKVVERLQEIYQKCQVDTGYCTEQRRAPREKRTTDLSEFAHRIPTNLKGNRLSRNSSSQASSSATEVRDYANSYNTAEMTDNNRYSTGSRPEEYMRSLRGTNHSPLNSISPTTTATTNAQLRERTRPNSPQPQPISPGSDTGRPIETNKDSNLLQVPEANVARSELSENTLEGSSPSNATVGKNHQDAIGEDRETQLADANQVDRADDDHGVPTRSGNHQLRKRAWHFITRCYCS